jgi:signal transduction histidine kinase/HAMP domain-containing protein
MNPFPFDITSYTINALSLVIVGLASVFYLSRLKEKSIPAWWMISGTSSFVVSMIMLMGGSLVLWGAAFNPLTDAFSVVCMAAMIEFAFRFPTPTRSWPARLIRIVAWGSGLAALGIGLANAYQILVLRVFVNQIPFFYGLLNPLTFLLALGVSLCRTVLIQNQRGRGLRGLVRAFVHPQNRAARLMRNFSLALSIGLIQGLISGFGMPPGLPGLTGILLVNTSLLLMLVAVVYASFDFTERQPSLVVRLVGLSLVTLLTVLGVISVYNEDLTTKRIAEHNAAVVADARKILHTGHLDGLPAEVVYVLRWPEKAGGSEPAAGRLVASRSGEVDPAVLLTEDPDTFPRSVWFYHIENILWMEARANGGDFHLRYGLHPPGSYYQYAGFVFNQDGWTYEVGFDLAELSRVNQGENLGMIWMVLGSALFILFVFPLFFRSNLIRPLDRLLEGVRQADGGDLDVHVNVSYQDEVGFLTNAFNNMIASLRQELNGRQKAETELHQLNLTLKERISERTYELEALYGITAASIQAMDSQTLLDVLLERSLKALRSRLGFILLAEGQGNSACFKLAAGQGLPVDWLPFLSGVSAVEGWVSRVSGQTGPLLVADTARDETLPAFIHSAGPLTLILAALQVEERTLGILGMARPADEKFDLDEIALLVSIVNQVGIAVHTDRLRQLVQQASVLEERQRLARDLHDSVTQSLYGLVTLTEVGLMQAESSNLNGVVGTYHKIGQSTRQAIREMRLFIHQLRPPQLEQEGLINALDLRLAAVEGRSDVKAQLIADESLHLPILVETALFHIAQEALNNSLKHACAANVTISLKPDSKGVIMEIVDDGKGFNPDHPGLGGMGLENMRARACEIGAELEIQSEPGQGTRVRVFVEEKN